VPNDVLDHGTTAGNLTFGYSSFNIPAGSTGISVQVRYYDRDVSSGTNQSAGRLKVGGNYYNASTHNPNTTLTVRSDNWANNPKTGIAWTVDDINGVGANALQAFGFFSGDANPQLRYSCIELQVTYTPPENRAYISGAELEVPAAPRRGQISGGEFEVPNPPRRSQISGAEFEVPDALVNDRRGEISGAELEVPTAPRRGQISGSEFEVPNAPRRGEISGGEMEIPDAPRRVYISGGEFEVPEYQRRVLVSGAEMEVPGGQRRVRISGVEFEIPNLTTGGVLKRWTGTEWAKVN
jgi:hypothetical protein